MKTKQQRREEALERQVAFESRTVNEQLRLIKERRGESKKELAALLKRKSEIKGAKKS